MNDTLQFHVPPACQGQIVENAYAMTDDGQHVILRQIDRSESPALPAYSIAQAQEFDVGDYWNGEPEVASEWRSLSDSEMRRHGLDSKE